jgi:hypothetical protein
MPRDGSGDFTRTVTPPNNGDVAQADDFNAEMNDIASALTASINTQGTKPFAANQPMAGFILTGLGAGSANGHSVRYEQLVLKQDADAQLAALAGISPVNGDMFYWTSSTSLAALASSGLGRTLLTNATASEDRTSLGLVIGTDVQAYSALLAAIAGLAVTDGNFIVGNGSTWVAESGSTARTSMGAVAKAGDTMTGELILASSAPTTPRSAGTIGIPQEAKTANYILALTDIGKRIRFNGTSLSCTIPPESSVAWATNGFHAVFRVLNINASAMTIVPDSGVTLRHRTLGTGTRTLAQFGTAFIEEYTTDSWLISGDGIT